MRTRRTCVQSARAAAAWAPPLQAAHAALGLNLLDQAFAADPEYAPYGAARQAGSRSIFTLIDDTDIAGAISYLPKG